MRSIKIILEEHSLKNVKPYITRVREPFFDIAKKHITENSVILDIGAGDGSFAKHIERDDIFMFDGNPETVESLKKDYKNVYYGKIPNLPFEDNKFDIIHTSHLVEHLFPQELYDLLKEIDRCLKPSIDGGFLIISAPLLHENFYNDMSHIKPYSPKVFVKYLCGAKGNPTRNTISNNYKLIQMQYRYRYKRPSFYYVYNNIINQLFYFLQLSFFAIGFRKLEKTGYTLVLKKTNVEFAN